MTLNDLLNVVDQLRTFPDLVDYLDARLALGDGFLGTLGHERLLFGHCLRNGGEFGAGRSLSEVAASLGHDISSLGWLLWAKHVVDTDAAVVDHMADALATFSSTFTMPGMDGLNLLKVIREIDQSLPCNYGDGRHALRAR